MSIRAVIFDIGGVLLRTEDQRYHRKWETLLGLAEGDLSKAVFVSDVSARATLGQATIAEVWQHVAQVFGLNAEQVCELERDFSAADALDQELLTFVRTLRPHYRTALLSNAWPGTRELYNQRYRFCDAVDEIILSAEEGIAKPHPDIYTLTAQRLGVQVHEAIFVDDWKPHVEAAHALGMSGVLFEHTAQAIADVRSYLTVP